MTKKQKRLELTTKQLLMITFWLLSIITGFVAILPIFYYSFFSSPIIFASIFVILNIFLLILNTKNTIKFPKLIINSLKLIIIIQIINIIFSTNRIASLFGVYSRWITNLGSILVYLSTLIISYILSTNLNPSLKKLKLPNLNKILLYSLSILIAILGIYQIKYHLNTGYTFNGITRISLTFTNPLYAGLLISMLLTYVSMDLITDKALKFKALTFKLTLVFLLSIVLINTYTRSAWIATILAIILSVLLILYLKFKNSKLILWTILIKRLLILTVVFVFATLPFINNIKARNLNEVTDSQVLTDIAQTIGGSISDAKQFFQNQKNYSSTYIRFKEWQWGLSTVQSKPTRLVTGFGSDTLYYVLPKFRPAIFNNFPTDAYIRPYYIRNLYITILISYGLPALLAFIYLNIELILKTLHSRSLNNIAIISTIISFLFNAVFYMPSFPFFMLYFTLIGLSLSNIKLKDTEQVKVGPKLIKLTGTILLIFITIWISFIFLSDYTLNQITYGNKDIGLVCKYNKIMCINPYADLFKRAYVLSKNSNDILTYIDKLAKSNDKDNLRIAASSLYAYAKKHNNKNLAQKSLKYYEKAIELEPTAPYLWDEMGLNYLYLKNYQEAENCFKHAIDLKQDYWYSYIHMGEVLRQEGKPQEAILWYKKVVDYLPLAINEIKEAEQEIDKLNSKADDGKK